MKSIKHLEIGTHQCKTVARFPATRYKKLQRLAIRESASINYLINEAVDEYIRRKARGWTDAHT